MAFAVFDDRRALRGADWLLRDEEPLPLPQMTSSESENKL